MASESGVDSNDIRAVERILLRLEAGLLSTEAECSIMFEVQTLSSWIIKFRSTGTIVNNCELVFPGTDIQTTISFKSHTAFWAVANGGEVAYDDALAKGAVVISGSGAGIDIFKRKLLRSVSNREPTISPVPLRTRGLSNGEAPLKSGWLLKKRDLFSGWRCRYFVVYMGRVDYFIDQHDMQTRGTVPLYGAEVSAARKMTINGVSDHWGMTVELGKVEPKQREKSFKLASELTGEEGMVEATTWVQVFTIASKRGQDIRANPSSATRISMPGSLKSIPSVGNANTTVDSQRAGTGQELASPSSGQTTTVKARVSSNSTLSNAADSTKATVAAVMAVASETTASSVTLPLPAIAVALVVLFFAGWMTGGTTGYDTKSIIIGVLVLAAATALLAWVGRLAPPNKFTNQQNIARDTSDNDSSEVLVRPQSRRSSRSRSNGSNAEPPRRSTTDRASDIEDDDSQE